jgi:hypothetical protein
MEHHDREDLLAEATALVERVELELPDAAEPVFAGFRPSGAASIYFGPDPVYHFNSRNELRRAYVAGLLYKAVASRLASLERRPSAGAVLLVRRDLDLQEQCQFLDAAMEQIDRLREALRQGACRVVGQHPADADVPGRVRRWLGELQAPLRVASSPHAR